MDFTYSEKVQALQKRLNDFMQAHVYPVEQDYRDALAGADNPWTTPPILEGLKKKGAGARALEPVLSQSAL